MNWLDIFLIVALVIPVLTSLRQGIIKVALSLAGLILGIVLASSFYEPLSSMLTFIPNKNVANIIAFILILSGVMVVASVLARLLNFITSVAMLGWVNHIGGAALGFVTSVLLWSALLATWVRFFGTGMISESFLAGVLLDKFPLILSLLPSEFDVIRDFFQHSETITPTPHALIGK
jgi:membrane protein required for colicin V production